MVYKQRHWRKKLNPLYVVEYGNVWIARMVRCFQDEMLDIPTTAMVLKCKPHVVRRQLRKLGILGKPVRFKRVRTYDRAIGADAYYKTQVLELCEQYDEVTSDILRVHALKAYKYLYKFDLEWLHGHMTFKSDSKKQRDEDTEMFRRVQNAVTSICANGMPKRQLTLGFIAVTAGYDLQALNYLTAKRPLTKAYVDTVVESRIDWLRRRISAIAQERRVFGEKISIADIKCEMSLKPNTFIKYEVFLRS
jgi:hypothetical protein